MHPELFQIFGKTIPTYGAAYASAILICVLLGLRRVNKEGIKEERFLKAILIAIVGIMVMSKGFHVAISWDWYMENPKRFLNFRIGHVFYGGYIGACLFPLVYLKAIKEPYLPIVDICATYMPLGLAWHRALGCFGAGCCYGRPTELPWGVTFPKGAPASELYGLVAVHPTQFYEALMALGMFGIMLYWRKNVRKIPGELITLQVALYAVGRFAIEFVRGDIKRGFLGSLSTSQWVSIGMLVGAGLLTAYILKKRKELETKAGA